MARVSGRSAGKKGRGPPIEVTDRPAAGEDPPGDKWLTLGEYRVRNVVPTGQRERAGPRPRAATRRRARPGARDSVGLGTRTDVGPRATEGPSPPPGPSYVKVDAPGASNERGPNRVPASKPPDTGDPSRFPLFQGRGWSHGVGAVKTDARIKRETPSGVGHGLPQPSTSPNPSPPTVGPSASSSRSWAPDPASLLPRGRRQKTTKPRLVGSRGKRGRPEPLRPSGAVDGEPD